MSMRAFILIALLPSVVALGEEPGVEQIVARARAVVDQKLGPVTCKMSIETRIFDKKGQLEHTETRDGEVKLDGDDSDFQLARIVRDGKPLGAKELEGERARAEKARAEKKKHGDDDLDMSPLASKNASGERFELLRKEPLWGHDAWVLKVSALRPQTSLASGTVWIDAGSFVELKGELQPAKLPKHADWLTVQEQFRPARGGALPSYLRITGAGHLLFFHKGFETTMKWSGCD